MQPSQSTCYGCVCLITLLGVHCFGNPLESGSAIDVHRWRDIAGNKQSAVLEWRIEQDSRVDKTLGFTKHNSPKEGTAWLSPDIARVDTYCLTAIGSDGLIHPQNRNPSFCRQQFRRLLFYDRIDRTLPKPQLAHISILFSKPQMVPSENLGALVQLSALAPVLAWNPELATDGFVFVVSERIANDMGRRLPVLVQTSAQQATMELWIDPDNRNRVRRMIYLHDGLKAGQVDFEYRDSVPSGWTVLEFAPHGFVIDFLKIAVTNVQLLEKIDESTFHLAVPSGRLRGLEKLRTSKIRDVVSLIRTFRWLAIVPLSFTLLGLLKWKRSLRFKILSLCSAWIAVIITTCGFLPIAEVSLREAHDDVTLLSQSLEVSFEPTTDRAMQSKEELLKRLKTISRHLAQSYDIRRENSLFAYLAGRDVAREKATQDLLKLAQFEIPNAMKSEANARSKWDAIRERLSKIDEHLSSYAFSPYHPPVPLSMRIENK